MDKILVLDFGGQYDQLIARRIRAAHVYAEIKAYRAVSPAEIRAAGYRGIVFTGGPHSVYAPDAPTCDASILTLGIPILGICYGHQLLAFLAGGTVAPSESGSEYGKTTVRADGQALFAGIPAESVCWMSHRDAVQTLPAGFSAIARTEQCACAAFADDRRRLYGVQFHPEVAHTEYGDKLLQNFLFGICGCAADWRMEDAAAAAVERCRRTLAGKRVLLALSGGVDSAVCAVLLQKAFGDRLTCVFVDHGLLRKGEGDLVERTFGGQFGIRLIRVNAQDRFFAKLAGVAAPEEKRRIIGTEFIRVFEEEAKKLGRIDVLAQGTIYPDVIESGKGDAAVIKATTTSAACRRIWRFPRLSSPCAIYSRTKCARSAGSSACPRRSCSASRSPDRGSACASSARSQRKKPTCCVKRTRSSARKWTRPILRCGRISISPCSRIRAASA